jgi:hypothetical protein
LRARRAGRERFPGSQPATAPSFGDHRDHGLLCGVGIARAYPIVDTRGARELSGWLAIGLVVIGLVGVACVVLLFDVLRGDVGGGRHTLARARRLLVVATDAETEAGAEAWIEAQRAERPELQCFLLVEHEGQELFMAIQGAIDRERPDAIVMARHAGESHWAHQGTYGRLAEEQRVPVDAIFVGAEAKA